MTPMIFSQNLVDSQCNHNDIRSVAGRRADAIAKVLGMLACSRARYEKDLMSLAPHLQVNSHLPCCSTHAGWCVEMRTTVLCHASSLCLKTSRERKRVKD